MRAGRFEAAIDILQVAGFVKEQSEGNETLSLKRNDPGLLWLALHAVTTALAAQGRITVPI